MGAAAVGMPVLQVAQEGQLVTLGQVSLSFYAVTGAVVQEVLERLGHRVEVRQGLHEEIFPHSGRPTST